MIFFPLFSTYVYTPNDHENLTYKFNNVLHKVVQVLSFCETHLLHLVTSVLVCVTC